MINTLAQVFSINSTEMLMEVRTQFEADLNRELETLERLLSQNVMSSDVAAVRIHVGYVESYRDRVTKYLMLAQGLMEHAKSDYPAFWLPKEKGITEVRRDAHRRTLSGGFAALAARLERLIDSIDSRVNLCKKIHGLESTPVNLSIQRRVS